MEQYFLNEIKRLDSIKPSRRIGEMKETMNLNTKKTSINSSLIIANAVKQVFPFRIPNDTAMPETHLGFLLSAVVIIDGRRVRKCTYEGLDWLSANSEIFPIFNQDLENARGVLDSTIGKARVKDDYEFSYFHICIKPSIQCSQEDQMKIIKYCLNKYPEPLDEDLMRHVDYIKSLFTSFGDNIGEWNIERIASLFSCKWKIVRSDLLPTAVEVNYFPHLVNSTGLAVSISCPLAEKETYRNEISSTIYNYLINAAKETFHPLDTYRNLMENSKYMGKSLRGNYWPVSNTVGDTLAKVYYGLKVVPEINLPNIGTMSAKCEKGGEMKTHKIGNMKWTIPEALELVTIRVPMRGKVEILHVGVLVERITIYTEDYSYVREILVKAMVWVGFVSKEQCAGIYSKKKLLDKLLSSTAPLRRVGEVKEERGFLDGYPNNNKHDSGVEAIFSRDYTLPNNLEEFTITESLELVSKNGTRLPTDNWVTKKPMSLETPVISLGGDPRAFASQLISCYRMCNPDKLVETILLDRGFNNAATRLLNRYVDKDPGTVYACRGVFMSADSREVQKALLPNLFLEEDHKEYIKGLECNFSVGGMKVNIYASRSNPYQGYRYSMDRKEITYISLGKTILLEPTKRDFMQLQFVNGKPMGSMIPNELINLESTMAMKKGEEHTTVGELKISGQIKEVTIETNKIWNDDMDEPDYDGEIDFGEFD